MEDLLFLGQQVLKVVFHTINPQTTQVCVLSLPSAPPLESWARERGGFRAAVSQCGAAELSSLQPEELESGTVSVPCKELVTGLYLVDGGVHVTTPALCGDR